MTICSAIVAVGSRSFEGIVVKIRTMSAAVAGLVLMSGVGLGMPAQARPSDTIIKERIGANPIVAGSPNGTRFRITVTNNASYDRQMGFFDVLDPGLQIQGDPVSSLPGG